ncbi:hypothetical protein MMPV_006362 [Pyropia vietnamensis]
MSTPHRGATATLFPPPPVPPPPPNPIWAAALTWLLQRAACDRRAAAAAAVAAATGRDGSGRGVAAASATAASAADPYTGAPVVSPHPWREYLPKHTPPIRLPAVAGLPAGNVWVGLNANYRPFEAASRVCDTTDSDSDDRESKDSPEVTLAATAAAAAGGHVNGDAASLAPVVDAATAAAANEALRVDAAAWAAVVASGGADGGDGGGGGNRDGWLHRLGRSYQGGHDGAAAVVNSAFAVAIRRYAGDVAGRVESLAAAASGVLWLGQADGVAAVARALHVASAGREALSAARVLAGRAAALTDVEARAGAATREVGRADGVSAAEAGGHTSLPWGVGSAGGIGLAAEAAATATVAAADVTPDPAEEVANTTVSALLCRRCGQFDCTAHPHPNAVPAGGAPTETSRRPLRTGGCSCGGGGEGGALPGTSFAGLATAAAPGVSAGANIMAGASSGVGQLVPVAPATAALVPGEDGPRRDDCNWSAADTAALRLFFADTAGDACALATILSVRQGLPLTCTAVRAAVARLGLASSPPAAPAAAAAVAGWNQPTGEPVLGLPPVVPFSVPTPPPDLPFRRPIRRRGRGRTAFTPARRKAAHFAGPCRPPARVAWDPCSHPGPCTSAAVCSCIKSGTHCERSCGCNSLRGGGGGHRGAVEGVTAAAAVAVAVGGAAAAASSSTLRLGLCPNRHPGCACKRGNPACTTSACACCAAERECDPDLCGPCGAGVHPTALAAAATAAAAAAMRQGEADKLPEGLCLRDRSRPGGRWRATAGRLSAAGGRGRRGGKVFGGGATPPLGVGSIPPPGVWGTPPPGVGETPPLGIRGTPPPGGEDPLPLGDGSTSPGDGSRCSPLRPPGGATVHRRCGNVSLTYGDRRRTAAGVSPVHGWGLFAVEPIPRDALIDEYFGEHVDDTEADRRVRARAEDLAGANANLSYLFGIVAGESLDSGRYGNRLRFANHAPKRNATQRRGGLAAGGKGKSGGCAAAAADGDGADDDDDMQANGPPANARARNLCVGGERRLGVWAVRDIAAGEEITFPYGSRARDLITLGGDGAER